jgi:hypothetical protein
LQPKAEEDLEGDGAYKDVDIIGDDVQAETEATERHAEVEMPATEVPAADIPIEVEIPHRPEVWACESRVVFWWLVIFEHLNNVFNLRRFYTGLGLRGIWMLFVWILLVVKLKFLVLMIYLFSLRRLMHSSLKAVVMHLRDHRVWVSGSCGLKWIWYMP